MPICVRQDRATGRFRRVVRCDSCQVLVINGLICHETGCPESYKDDVRDCKWCGQNFKPESMHQICCDEECAGAYYR